MIVVDTNVIAYMALPSPYSAEATRLHAKDPDWAAPYLWRSEFRNVLMLHMRKGLLSFAQAVALHEKMAQRMKGREFHVSASRVLRLVNESDCSACDCEFVALAQELDTQVVTLDRKPLRAFPDTCVSLQDAAD